MPDTIGFTGTRHGMTIEQAMEVAAYLRVAAPKTVVHGACVGADQRFVCIARDSLAGVHIVARPGRVGGFCDFRSVRAIELSDVVHPDQNTHQRNRLIVETTEVLIACPDGPERRRSGTWSTVRYARKLKRPIVIVMPNGRVVWEADGVPHTAEELEP